MKGCFLVLLLAAFSAIQIQGNFLQRSVEELKQLRNEINVHASYDQGKADLIFLLDGSSNLSPTDFQTEKRFVRNLLNNVHVGVDATRVEVIPFASRASIFINYISSPAHEKNKCTFNEKFHQLTFRRGATNMREAFNLAYEIVGGRYSMYNRISAKTVAILLSSGAWNTGGDPASYASILKRLKVEIFALAVGVHPVYSNLRALATSADHVFDLSRFTEFKQLAVYIRGDPHEKRFQTRSVNPAKCNHDCDSSNAPCGCDLVTGVYNCACRKGFYGTGKRGDCRPCPASTYKDFQGYATECKRCPANSGHSKTTQTSIVSCECFVGYRGQPYTGKPCTNINECANNNGGCSHMCHGMEGGYRCSCPSGMKLTNGGRSCVDIDECTGSSPCDLGTSRCVNTPGDHRCECRSGFERESRYKCRDKNECVGKNSCDVSKSICVNIVGDYICRCKTGYQRGASNKICEPKSCPALTTPTNGGLLPKNCATNGGKYLGHCSYSCKNGYTLVGDSKRTCQADGTWDGATPKCNKIPGPHYKHKGCYKDSWHPRAMPDNLGDVDSVRECAVLAKNQGFKAFGLQDGVECWSGPRAHETFKKYGSAHKCLDGMGGQLTNDVYFFSG